MGRCCLVDITKWAFVTVLCVSGSYLTSAQPTNFTQPARDPPPATTSAATPASDPSPFIAPVPAPAPAPASDRYAGLLDYPTTNVFAPPAPSYPTQPQNNPPPAPQNYQPEQNYPPQGYQPQGYQPQGYQPQGYQPQGYQPQGYQPQAPGYEVEQPELYNQASKFGTRPADQYPQPQGYPQQGYPPQGYPPQGNPPQGRRYEYEAAEVEATTPQPYPQAYPPQYIPPPPSPPSTPAHVLWAAAANQIPRLPEPPKPPPPTGTPNPAMNAKLAAKVTPQYMELFRGHLVMAQQRKLLADNLRQFLTPPSYAQPATPRFAPSSYYHQSPSRYSGAVKEVYEMLSTGEMKCKNLYRLHNLDYMRYTSSVCGQRLRCPAPYGREVQMGNFCMCCPYLDPGTMQALQSRPQM